MSEDRRKAPRAEAKIAATLFASNERLQCELLNVSTTGLAFVSKTKQLQGASVRIRFRLPGDSTPIDADGVLVRRSERGSDVEWGVRFLNPRPEVSRRLREFVGKVLPVGISQEKAVAGAAKETTKRKQAEADQKRRLAALYRRALSDLH